MFFLFTNTVKPDVDRTELAALIPAHITWTQTQIAHHVVLQAGRWGDQGGAGILKADTADQALEILVTDPLINSGLVEYDLRSFFPDVPL